MNDFPGHDESFPASALEDTNATATTVAAAQQPPSSSSLFCPNCGSKDIEHQDASAVCMDCGVVVEENAIVSSVEFVEGAGGSSSMVGQFVSATSSKAYPVAAAKGRGGGWGFSRDSRETTLNNGRRRIQEIASRLRLQGHFIDAAHRLFTIAVEKNFVQGRRTTHVVASCLYIVCRQEKSQHMLIDFSDALQVNVYSLGTCFLKFRRLLGLKLEIIDPALYVYRFAAHLDLDEKANAVALTALRLVARMKEIGYICAAALLIAARAHGFSKHAHDVQRILKVCGMTVASRVREFELTPAAQLTLEDFHKQAANSEDPSQQQQQELVWQSEADPPAWSRNKIQEARVKAIQQGNVALLESGALDDPLDGPRKGPLWREPERETKHKNEMKQLYANLEQELVATDDKSTPAIASKDEEKETTTNSPASPTKKQEKQPAQEETQIVAYDGALKVPAKFEKVYPRNGAGKLVMLSDHATQEEMQQSVAPVEAKLSLTDFKKDMPDSMEHELDDIFRTDEEEMQKEAIFNKINKDYLEQQERKDSLKHVEETGEIEQDQDDAAQVEGHARYTQKKRSRRKRKMGDIPEEEQGDTADGVEMTVENYDALSSIFDEDGSLGNVVESSSSAAGGGGMDDAMYEGL
eukprot:CAMPEP_0168780430 /NCGR_PEP_ID=MMETSP0725-20121227/8115_1 /TAXON_ID=265536 /ORGANISM="Amphiprora sp., Strain CCMP467" /LENGTH=637 /DNA_ID=CAMNT_0008830273 /DNA_START=106 /DNA_END=2020 /DNA_ORIENTATION=+